MSLTKIMFAYQGQFGLGDTVDEAYADWMTKTGVIGPTTGYFLARVEPGATIDANGNIQPSNYQALPHL